MFTNDAPMKMGVLEFHPSLRRLYAPEGWVTLRDDLALLLDSLMRAESETVLYVDLEANLSATKDVPEAQAVVHRTARDLGKVLELVGAGSNAIQVVQGAGLKLIAPGFDPRYGMKRLRAEIGLVTPFPDPAKS